MRNLRCRYRGLSLVEILVVVGIMLIVMGILLAVFAQLIRIVRGLR